MFLQNISKFISNYRYEQATAESITVIKAAFLDYFGVTYRGINEQASQIACYTIDEIFKGNSDLNLKNIENMVQYRTYKGAILCIRRESTWYMRAAGCAWWNRWACRTSMWASRTGLTIFCEPPWTGAGSMFPRTHNCPCGPP